MLVIGLISILLALPCAVWAAIQLVAWQRNR